MQVNNHGQHDQIIYPRNIKKYTGLIEEVRSRAKGGNNKISSFGVLIKTANFLYQKNFPSRQEAESELIKQNHENKLEIKNIMWNCGNHYKIKLSGRKFFLADKIDFIEAYIWNSSNNYACCKQNGRQIQFHNLILGHNPGFNAMVDHFNCCRFDNCRINLRIATRQVQSINQTPQNGLIQSGVCFNKNTWVANWMDEQGIQKNVYFSINKLGYEVAK